MGHYARILLILAPSLAFGQQTFSPRVQAAVGTPSQVLYGNGMKSIDLGRTWTPLYLKEPGSPQPPFSATEIDPLNPAILYVMTTAAEGSFWKSTDSGVTWRKSATGLPADASPDAMRQISSGAHALYLKVGARLYKSVNKGELWTLQSQLPGSDPVWEVALSNPQKMYAVDREPNTALDSLRVYASEDEGRTWTPMGAPVTDLTSQRAAGGIGVVYARPSTILVSVSGCCEFSNSRGQGAYLSENGGATFALLGNGVSVFSRMYTGPDNNLYAPSSIAGGYYRSINEGASWKSYFSFGTQGVINVNAIDPVDRTIVYGNASSAGLVRSTDSADTWTAIPATITPTLGKPSTMIQIDLEEGASFGQPFTLQLAENATWILPVTIPQPAESWLTVAATSGNTPLTTSIRVRTTGLAPGVYTSSIRIDAPQSFNKSVTVPVQLTVRPRGTIGPQYKISTIAGSGGFAGPVEGVATELSLSTITSVAVDSLDRLLISDGNRIRRLSGGSLSLIAGTGVSGTSTGDGGDPKSAAIDGPQSLVVNSQGDIFLSERFRRKVRRIQGNTIDSYLDAIKVSSFFGASGITLDTQGKLILTGTGTLTRYDGVNYGTVVNAGYFSTPTSVTNGPNGGFFVADDTKDQIWWVPGSGEAPTVYAGIGTPGFSGDGGSALAAQLNNPTGLALDKQGTLYFTDSGNHRVRAISPNGTIRTIAGNGLQEFGGDGLAANLASFNRPEALAIDKDGNLYVGDTGNRRVRKLVLEIGATPKPDALLHGASGNAKLSPGSLFSIYGNQLSGTTRITGDTPWPRFVDGVAVTINGVAAPLYYVSPTQINGQIPYETAVGTATALVTFNGSTPAQVTFPIVAANPGVLVYGGNRAVAVNPTGAVNAVGAPAKPGDVELIYFSGIGVPGVSVATGAGSPSTEPLGRSQYQSTIKLNGQPVEVFYLGLAPGYPALCQANFRIPQLPPGDYPLTITVNGEESNVAMLSVGAP